VRSFLPPPILSQQEKYTVELGASRSLVRIGTLRVANALLATCEDHTAVYKQPVLLMGTALYFSTSTQAFCPSIKARGNVDAWTIRNVWYPTAATGPVQTAGGRLFGAWRGRRWS